MTQARIPHTRPAPTLTGGDDRPATPCADRWYVYDTIIEGTGPTVRNAIAEARSICATCPIAIKCLSENAAEDWARAVITGKTLMQRTRGAGKGKASKSRSVERLAAHNEKRRAALEDFADLNTPLPEVLQRLHLNRDALRKWCLRNGHHHLWDRLVGKAAA